MFGTKIIKHIFIALLLSSFANAEGLFDKPLPICTNIKSYIAYEMAVVVKQKCDPHDITMSLKDLHQAYLPMMTDEYASVRECRTACALLQATSGIEMNDCVKNDLTRSFVNGAINADKK